MVGLIHEGDDRRPYFFLSYARSRFRPEDGTDPDRWVTKLYRDLCHDVALVSGTSLPGFMDRQIPAGTQWPERLADALANCRVFVALLSPAYFTSEYCGKEWAAFVDRVRRQQAIMERQTAIIPALWTRMDLDELPPSLHSMQYIPPGFPTQYSAEGFYGIMKLGRYREQYKQAVLQLARLVKETAMLVDLPTGPISDFEGLENAFADHQGRPRGQRPVRLTVAAHHLGQLPPDRDFYYYGRTAQEWAPYRNGHNMQPIAAYAKQVVTDLGHQAVLDTVGPPTVGAAESQEAPAILLVDPWVTRDPMFCAELRQIDEDPVNVLTPFNVDDPQTGAAEADLTHRLDSVLGRSLALHGSAVHIPTLEAFRGAVSKAVSEAVTRYFKTTTVHPPQVPPTMARPTLELPEK